MEPLTRELVEAAASGSPDAVRSLVTRLGPVVRTAVARILFRYKSRASGRNLAQEAEDLAQEAMVALFEDQARVLRSWLPEKGASLETFVRIVAERTALSILRSGRRSPFTEDPTEDFELSSTSVPSPEDQALSRDMLVTLHDRLKETLSPRGYLLFMRLFVEEADVGTVAEEVGMAKDAIYAWKARFGKTVRSAAEKLDNPATTGGLS
ncbi:MAG TPA: sigma-70 family RNA polymerase sigma factor [Labilithrix sp.]|nr:sigma-70 family RNA polymerase sigma factor [Labilithrix sp.]